MDYGVFSAISTTFKLAEFCLALKEVNSENLVFLKLIARVRKDLEEASRERREKEPVLKSSLPGNMEWIDGAILDVRSALNDIGTFIERPRIDVEEGKPVSLKHRFEWVLMNHQKFVSRQLLLATCHQSLLVAITTMKSIPACSQPSLVAPEPEQIKMLPSPSRRRPSKRDMGIFERPIVPSSDEEGAFCASLTPPSLSPSPVEAGEGFELNQNYLQEAPIHEPPPSYSASWLPVIQPMSISLDEILLSGKHDEVEALAAAADALDAQGGGFPAVSEMVDSLRRTATLERNRRVTTRVHSAVKGESKI